jgi:AMP deaminase
MEGHSLRRQSTHHNAVDLDEEAEIYAYKSRLGEAKHDKDYPIAGKDSPFLQTENGNDEEPSETPQTDLSTPSNEDGVEYEPRHPYYNYATEKSDTQADAKLIYQRHRLDTSAAQSDIASPLLMAKSATLPSAMVDSDSLGLGHTTSTTPRALRTSIQNLSGMMNYTAPTSSREAFPPFEKHEKGEFGRQGPDPFLAADAQARSHAQHHGLPHEFKDPLLAREGFHGAGAGVGIGSGADGLAASDDAVIYEIEAICKKIKTVLDLREAYLRVSLQCPGDNPKDEESWEIYPPPPEPVWTEDKVRPAPENAEAEAGSLSNSLYMADTVSTAHGARAGSAPSVAGSEAQMPQSPTTRKRRKAGQAIGEDFDMNECFIPGKSSLGLTFTLDEGSVYQVYENGGRPIVQVPTLRDYYIALDTIGDLASDGPAKSFAYRRLQYLEGRYNLYTLLNEYQEVADTKKVPHRDFYNVRKVDTHIHHSACMNQKHLLRFIKSKMKKCPDEIVLFRDRQHLTLREVFESINLTAYDLSIDTLDMHAHTDSFHRFDKFNLKYNPIGQSRLREIFLKTDNFIKGRYLAEITREVIADLESSKYQMVEWRISIYGRNIEEWDKLAAWVVDNKLFSPNVRWLIQIPRLYAMYKATGTMDNFEAVIQNVFQPLFEVTQDPSSHPKLHIFLQRVIGFDSVDDESKIERRLFRKFPTPKEWNTKQNPPYGYWIYHLYANMTSLNMFRKRRGFNTFLLRPHCGEAGDTDHLAAAILCCHSISHGIMLRKVPLLQYVFYLDQIGIAMSPLSNNALFLTYDRNPFHSYFRKGMNVSLSTDDPLQFAFTRDPLIEEYSVAAQIYKFSAVDMCELAKHSVDQSGFELSLKRRWLGKYCYLPGVLGNDVAKCNVPNIREAFRHETLKAEHTL